MNIIFLTHYYWPRVGGVERHVERIADRLRRVGNKITIITEKYQKNLRTQKIKDNINIIRFEYPHVKILGLLYIWYWLWKNRSLIKQSDLVHCHDVFIWYLPFRFLFPKKVVYTTFHGWEGKYPIPLWNIFLKRLAAKLSRGNICVGKYIEKWYGIKADYVTYGGVDLGFKIYDLRKIRNSIVYLGRLEEDTGVRECIRSLVHGYKDCQIDFVGDGALRNECEKYGKVYGFVNPGPYLQKAEYCVPGGYLAYLEAKAFGCKIMTFANNPLKKDYWEEIEKLKTIPTWDEVAETYENLYRYHRS